MGDDKKAGEGNAPTEGGIGHSVDNMQFESDHSDLLHAIS
jgi:hypothetical protein